MNKQSPGLTLLELIAAAAVIVLATVAVRHYSQPVTKPDWPRVSNFTAKLLHNGQPVSFPSDQQQNLEMILTGTGDGPRICCGSYRFDVQSDGTVTYLDENNRPTSVIQWMPVGGYYCILVESKGDKRIKRSEFPFVIIPGKSNYDMDLSRKFVPAGHTVIESPLSPDVVP